ncbi:unnamed protein product [Adineta steineri]|uniref:Uncharacterized protein n=1 Tax=Adineta steineri TaxID=433720 RepID=A0A815BA41_9BILA|nr:unnamed protein product [Adineta steineri]CAF1554695.1 unnamed protein product [Adineta steineri]
MNIPINNQIDPLARLQTWRDKKYREIDEEYNRKVNQLRNESDDVSIDQIQQLQKQIDILKNQIDEPKEIINEWDMFSI